MKPKPFASLNHLTRPVMRDIPDSSCGWHIRIPAPPAGGAGPAAIRITSDFTIRSGFPKRNSDHDFGVNVSHARPGMTDTMRLTTLLDESRTFPPTPEFRAAAHAGSEAIYDAGKDSENFWAAQAEQLAWSRKWTRVLEW